MSKKSAGAGNSLPPSSRRNSLSKEAFAKYKPALARALVQRMPADMRTILAKCDASDLEFSSGLLGRAISHFFPRGFPGSLGQAYRKQFAAELVKAARISKQGGSEKARADLDAAEELKQMQRIRSVVNSVDMDVGQRFLGWYKALSLEERGYFHKVAANLGEGVLAEMVKMETGELDGIIKGSPGPGTDSDTPAGHGDLARRISENPMLQKKVEVYLRYLGRGRAEEFYRAAAEKLDGDLSRLDFVLDLPADQIDAYLGLGKGGLLQTLKAGADAVFGDFLGKIFSGQ